MTGPTRCTARAVVMAVVAGVMLLLPACGDRPETDKQVIILGFDGMDPKLCELMLNQGRLPSLARLRDAGGFRALGTSTPPQSPVAWSTFITGTNPGEHGIFDFVHRDPKNYGPYDSTCETKEGSWALDAGKWKFYLKGGEVLNLRKGKPFWEYLTEGGVPASICRIPAIYPPQESKGAEFRSLSDMGTPDIRGSLGEFSYYTSGPIRKRISGGGAAYRLSFKNNMGQGAFYGPPDGMLAPPPDKEFNTKPTEVPFTIYRDPTDPTIRILWQDQEVLLSVGEWSEWYPVEFEMGPRLAVGSLDAGPAVPNSTAYSICRFLLKRARPFLELYVTPFNIDPLNPSLPISVPDDFAVEVAQHIGRYYTQGLPQDTKALSHGVLTTDEFLQQADIVRRERIRMLDYALEHFQRGVLFFYFGGTDMVAHMFWGARHPDHPALTEEQHQKYKDVVDRTYLETDRVVGQVMDRFPQATVIVMSDHGFETFTRQFNPNNWLVENGYAVLAQPDKPDSPPKIDFAKSRAYAMGINGLYVNLLGREGQGIVPPSEKQVLLDEIADKLLAYRDPKTGKQVIKEMYQSDRVYSGPNVKIGPDMQIGYDRTFRGSWQAGLGGLDQQIMSDNTDAWCADHCIATDLVPGVLFTNRPIALEDPDLTDLAPTLLDEFGVQVPPKMHGRNVFKKPGTVALNR